MNTRIREGTPEISIGLPVYNGELFLIECLDSLLNQSFTDFKLIISDNCSTDKTQEICLTYQERDPRIQYIRQEKNIGAPKNFAFVLEQAESEYFMWAACDDVWAPNFLSTVYENISSATDAVLSSCALISFKADPHEGREYASFTSLGRGTVTARALKFIWQDESLGKANMIYGLMKREAVKSCDALNRYSLASADNLFVLQMLLKGTAVMEKSVLFHKRMPNSIPKSQLYNVLISPYREVQLALSYLDVIWRGPTPWSLRFGVIPVITIKIAIRLARLFKEWVYVIFRKVFGSGANT